MEFLKTLQDIANNPLFLGGVGMMSGGHQAMMQGMQFGNQMQDKQKQRQALEQGLGSLQGLQPNERAMLAGNPELAQGVLAQIYRDRFDPDAKLNRTYKQTQIDKMNQEIATGGEAYGKTGSIFLNPETNQYEAVQWGGKGQIKRTPLGGLTPSRGVGEIDTGTGTQIFDKATGQPVRDVAKDVAGAASLKEQGEAQGKAITDMPRQADNADLALKTIEAIRNHPGKKWGLGAVGVLPGVPGTQQRGFVNLVDQAKGQVFLQAFNSLRGGGQITEAEGAKATQALARLDRAQTPKDFDAALSDLEVIVKSGLSRAKTGATRTPYLPGRTNGTTPSPSGQIPPEAVRALRANPQLRADFEAKYGVPADQFLGR